jgi:hypothetical protein
MGVEETGQLLENPTKLNELGDSAPEFLPFELSPNAFFSTDCAYKRHASSLLLAVYFFLFLRSILGMLVLLIVGDADDDEEKGNEVDEVNT